MVARARLVAGVAVAAVIGLSGCGSSKPTASPGADGASPVTAAGGSSTSRICTELLAASGKLPSSELEQLASPATAKVSEVTSEITALGALAGRAPADVKTDLARLTTKLTSLRADVSKLVADGSNGSSSATEQAEESTIKKLTTGEQALANSLSRTCAK